MMKRPLPATLLLFFLVSMTACRNKTVKLLSGRWDCVEVENIIPPDAKGLTKADSTEAEQIKTLLLSFNWTFKKNMGYQCAINERITQEGKYELLMDDKMLLLKPSNNTATNRYMIRLLTENDLVISGNMEKTALLLHFKPH
jgi:hypothetical protein